VREAIEKKAPLWQANNNSLSRTSKSITGDIILLSAFFLYCVKYTYDYSEIFVRTELVNTILLVFSIGLPLLKIIFMQRYSTLRLIVTSGTALVMGVSCLLGGNFLFLNGFIFILAMQDVELDKIVRLNYWFKVASTVFHVLWYIVLYVTAPESITFFYRTAGEPRHSFLMGHPNLFMAILVWTCLEFIYLNYGRLRVYHIAFMWLVNTTFYSFTDSNTGIVVLAVCTVLIAVDKFGRGHFRKLLTMLARYLYSVCALWFSLMAIVYTWLNPALKALWLDIDALLTGRMWYSAYAFDVYGFTILGRQLDFPSKVFWGDRWLDGFAYFDNYYHGNLILFGIIHMVLTALVFVIYGKKMEARDKIIVVAFTLYAGMESYVTNVLICFALLIVGKYIYMPTKKLPANGPAAPPDEKKPLWKRPLTDIRS